MWFATKMRRIQLSYATLVAKFFWNH